ncbi:MAG: threonine/serine dehydratase [Symbiobacteriaceae bacterium]|nr:threonine/serine dehydratase [Symbiobacteriaceae bacterium]
MLDTVTLASIQSARARLQGIIYVTPVMESKVLSEIAGMPLYFKCENLQRTGAFKLRGSYNKLSQLSAQERSVGVITASSGNSGCGTAFAGKLLGLRVVVVTSNNPAPAKKAALEAYGAEIHYAGQMSSERLARVDELSAEFGLTVIHAYDDPQVIAGQGTIGLEMLEQMPDVEQIVVQIGGGGLLGGISTALRTSGYRGRIVGVEPEVSARMTYSLAQGQASALPLQQWAVSVGDGINSNKIGNYTYPLIREYVDQVVTVSEAELLEATKLQIEQGKMFVEPSGAATFAAALAGKLQSGLKTICLISGGNSDIHSLARLMS